jgi:hypothetical protein
MSFKRLDPEDFVVSADAVSSTVWSNNAYTLENFFTSSTQAASVSGKYYLNMYNTASNLDGAVTQFNTVPLPDESPNAILNCVTAPSKFEAVLYIFK